MIFFLLIILCLYGGINFYAFFQAKNIFHFSGKFEFIIITLLVLFIFAPIIVRFAEKLHCETLVRSIAYCGYLWMAFVFLFFFINITFNTVGYLFNLVCHSPQNDLLRNIFFGLSVGLSMIFVIYGFFDAQKIRVRHLEIHAGNQLPHGGKIRVVQISDVHVGLIIRDNRLKVILDRVKEANPDILVSTGDLLDGELDNVMTQAKQFAEIKPKYGKYAVTGNHEYYAGIENAMKFTQEAGFEILHNEDRQIAGISIVGLDDPTGIKMGLTKNSPSLKDLLPANQSKSFILLLKHQPRIYKNIYFNLQLSGHTHDGQIFPFMFFTRLFFPQNYGYYKLEQNKSIYVSSGAGTWGPPVRFWAPPEITVIDIMGK